MRFFRTFAVSIVVLSAADAVVSLSAEPSQRTDTASLEALLTEVRALRTDFNQVARISLGSQLATVRLQLQEQRIAAAAGQLADLRKRIDGSVAERTDLQLNLNRAEEGIRSGPVDPKELPNIENQIARLKGGITRLQAEEQSLRLQETDLSSQIATDQAVWSQVNAKLEELERQLSDSR